MDKNFINNITLNNGVQVPPIGFGVFRITDDKQCENAVLQAIQAGYRLIDTASAYENEEAVGNAVRKSNVPREELFVTTKLWITDTSYEGAYRGLEKSLKRLQMDYVDLYVIHQPYNDYYGAWRALEEFYRQGKVRAIGVDNFTQDRLADFLFFNDIVPMVNLIECNAFFQREEELQYMKEQHVQMMAWSPLAAGSSDLCNNTILCQIAEKYNKSVPQIILRWLTQRGIVPLVKSIKTVRMKENLDIFDFMLTEADMDKIKELDTGHSCFAPRKTGTEVHDFLKNAMNYHV